jgi:hypothetical protein
MADLKVNNITNYDGTTGPVIAGVSTVLSTSHFVVPVGNTFKRSVTENIVNDGLVLYLDAGNDVSYDAYENLLTYSEQFDNAAWTKQNGFSITPNTAIAPDGTLTADTASRINLNLEYLYQNTNASGTYTLSCWVRASTGTTTFILLSYNGVDGSIVSPTFTATTTWQRFSFTATVTTTNGWYPCIPAVSGDQLYIWGAQLERGSSVGPYYPTTGAAKTRGTTWTDLSGNNNTGTLTNGPTYSSANGGSIVFDGTNDYVSVPSYIQSPNTQLTLNLWTKPNSTAQQTTLMSKWGSSSQSNFSWLLFLNWFASGTLYFLVGNASGNDYTRHSIPHNLSTSSYINYTITYNSGLVNMYMNGNLISSSNSAYTTLKAVTTPITIGADWDGGSVDTLLRFYNGNIATTQIYNRALSAAEVSQNFNATRSRYGI